MDHLPGYAFKADFPYPIWLVERPHDLPRDDEPVAGRRSSSWVVVYENQTSSGIGLVGYRHGVFRFNFPSGHPAGEQSKRDPVQVLTRQLKYMNCFALCLHSALASVDRVDMGYFFVTPTDLFGAHAEPVIHAGPGPLHMATGDREEILSIGKVKAEVLDAAFNLFEACDVNGNDTISLVALLNQAAYVGRNADLSLCVVLSWTVAEKLLNLLWHRYIDAQVTGQTGASPSKKRMEKYNGRDYTASVVTEILTLAGVMPASLCTQLDVVRRARNAWVHSINEPTLEIAARSVELARDMLNEAHGIYLELRGKGSMITMTDPNRARKL